MNAYLGRARNGRERWVSTEPTPESDNRLVAEWLGQTIDPKNDGDTAFLAALTRVLRFLAAPKAW
jgi:hypothetical protein